MSGAWRARAAALTLLGTLVVHQGRYLAFPHAEDHHAHVYFRWLLPVMVAVTFVLLAEFAARLAHAHRESPGRLPRTTVLWAFASATLLTIFGAQEALESFVTHGVWPGPAELMATGGWSAAPLAVLVGGAIALLLRGAEAAVAWARAARAPTRPSRSPLLPLPESPLLAPRGSLLGQCLAGRAPPLTR